MVSPSSDSKSNSPDLRAILDEIESDSGNEFAAQHAIPDLTSALRACLRWSEQLDVEADLIDRIGHQADVARAKRDAAAGIRDSLAALGNY